MFLRNFIGAERLEVPQITTKELIKKMNSLIKIGWNTFFQNSVSEEEFSEFSVARVTEEQRSEFHIRNELGEFSAIISGKFRFKTTKSIDFPTVGDWVLIRSATIKD